MHSLLVVTLLLCGAGTRAKLCLLGDFESQIQYLMDKIMMSKEEVALSNTLFDDLRATLNRRWPGTKVHPIGSLTTGVALKLSDADGYVEIPTFNSSADIYVLNEAKELLLQEADLYSRITPGPASTSFRNSILTFYHNPTKRYCDVAFKYESGLRASHINDYFINLDEMFKPLMGVVKYWSKIHQLTGPNSIDSYGMYLLVIFYLQQKNLVPSVYTLQRQGKSYFVSHWDMGFERIPYKITNTESLYQLLGGFFKYYNEFNFKDYIVSPYAGRPIQRTEFSGREPLPKEFYLYKVNLRKHFISPLDINSELCIQEVFEHNLGAADKVPHDKVAQFTSHVKFAAKMFEEQSSRDFLSAILVKDQHYERHERIKIINIDQVSTLADCFNDRVQYN